MNNSPSQSDSVPARFNPFKIIIPVAVALLSVSLMSQWYANNISFPRYCKNPERALTSLQNLMKQSTTIDHEQRRQTMIAAKLLFLHPVQAGETRADYLQRLRYLMLTQCG
jgi:hypothetical protein